MGKSVAARRWGAYLLLAGALGGLALFRVVNLDEGWYLGAARSVYEGRLLYRDFAYTQAPLLPYVYGVAYLLPFGPLYSGRALTVLLALAALGLTGRTARRLAGPRAEVATLLLFTASLYVVAHYAYTATYALAACLIALGVAIAVEQSREQIRNVAATTCLCLAAGARLSVMAALPPFMLYLIWVSHKRGEAFLSTALTALVVLAALFGPFVLAAGPQAVLYNTIGFHADRMLPEWRSGVIQGALRETFQAFPLLLLGTAAAAWVVLRPGLLNRIENAGATGRDPHHRPQLRGLMAALLAMSGALGLAQLAPRTAAGYYNALQAPMLAALGGITFGLLVEEVRRRDDPPWMYGLIAVLPAVVLCGYAWTQWGFLQRQGLLAGTPFVQIERVRAAAAYLSATASPDEPLITFNTHLALEAGLPVPPGFEMAIFSYRPAWTTEQAIRNHAVNNEMLADLWSRAQAPVAVTEFDLHTLYGDKERLLGILHAHYRWAASFPRFGPFFDDLRVYFPPRYDPPAPQRPLHAQLEQGIRLLGYDIEIDRGGATPALRLGLYWHARGPTDRPLTVFTHLLDGSGGLAVGQDNQPCRGTCPTDTWRAGEVIRDEYVLVLRPGEYLLEVGFYDPATWERLPVLSETGKRVEDRIVLERASFP